VGQLLDVLACAVVADKGHVRVRRCAYQIHYSVHLVEVVVARQQRRPRKQLSQDAPDRPDVQLLVLLFGVENDFWRPLPACHDLLCLELIWVCVLASAQAEITNFEVTLFVEEQIGGFEVAVDDVGFVHLVRAFEDLLHEELQVVVGEVLLGVNYFVQVGFHQFGDQLDVLLARAGRRTLDVSQRHYVGVVEELKQLDFALDAFGVDEVLESFGHLLDGHLAVAHSVERTADHPLRPHSNQFDEFLPVVHNEHVVFHFEYIFARMVLFNVVCFD